MKKVNQMQINSVQLGAGSGQQVSGSNFLAKVKQDFEALGSALDAGNLTDAKKAFAQLQKDAPSQGDKNNPLSDTIASLGKDLDSGDLKSAQADYAKIKKRCRKSRRGQGRRAARGANGASGAGGGSQSNKTYDVRDTNKDGVVSAQEELDYEMTHPTAAKNSQSTPQTTASTTNGSAGETINIQA